jgi:hypothetical protein
MKVEIDNYTYWQRIYLMSKIISHTYHGDKLPTYKWDWPKNGFLTRRMAEVKAREAQDAKAESN